MAEVKNARIFNSIEPQSILDEFDEAKVYNFPFSILGRTVVTIVYFLIIVVGSYTSTCVLGMVDLPSCLV